MRYVIRMASNYLELSLKITAALKEGWEPVGGVVIDGGIFYQAMIKKD